MRLRILMLFIMVCFLSFACVENIITINLDPNGQSYFRFHSRGDSLDIFNDDFSHPKDSMINISTISIDNDNWSHITEISFDDSTYVFSNNDSLPLGYKFDKHIVSSFLKTEYELRLTFNGRMIRTEYPKLYSALISKSMDSLEWVPEAFAVIMKKGLEGLVQDSLMKNNVLLIDRLVNHMRNSLANITTMDQLKHIHNNKIAFLSELLRPFKVKEPIPSKLAKSMKPYEDRLRRTMDLSDDVFIIKVLMPGQIFQSNAKTMLKDTLIWDFGIDSLLQTDYEIMAKSVIYDMAPLKKYIMTFLIFFSSLIFLFLRKNIG
jgi:hypothetical protein|tara:strand:- start:31 stop:987 length:957 start_codon:yes stop_codon:yes gene_type:complete